MSEELKQRQDEIYNILVAKGLDTGNAALAVFNYYDMDNDAHLREGLSDILWGLFTWAETEQGHSYWYDIATQWEGK